MKRNRLKHPKKLRIPDFEDDKEELLRLMRRIRPVEEDTDGCHVCGDAHFCEDCPCFDMIPRVDLKLGPEYDKVCIGCGRIGEICHSKGAYAVRKRCGGCGDYGHWYWENSCDEDWRKPDYIAEIPSIEELEEEVMNKKDKAVVEEDEESDDADDYKCLVYYDDQGRRKKIRVPHFLHDKEEILRLMKRIPPSPPAEKKDTLDCPVCGDDHLHEDCPCFDRIPPDVVLRPEYDMICRGCGKIGEICCSKGAYAELKSCGGCCCDGHWYWENKCSKDWCRPSHTVKIPSIKQLEEVVMKNKYKVPAEEDDKKDDDAKGGNEFLKQSSIGRKKHKSRSKSKRTILRKPDYIAEIPSIEELEEEVMNKKGKAVVEEDEESDVEGDDDCDVFLDDQGRRKKIKSPDFLLDKEEILRLMKRIPPSPPAEKKGMLDCPVCGDDHFHEDCPCFDRIPGDVVLRPEYDMICRGCGKIGEICCSKGAYAKLKRCGGCCRTGHWYWENKCSKDWRRPSHTVKIPSIKKLEEEVMKNKYKVPAEEDDDEAKRGNEFLKQSSIGRKKHKSRSKSKRKILRRSSIGPEKFEAISKSQKMVWDILLRPEIDAQTQAAQQVRMPDMSPVMAKLEISGAGASPADEVEAKIDETGIEPVYIDLDMTQGSKAGKGFQDSQ